MNRRTLIASFGAAALAGCVGGDPGDDTTETPVESPTDAPSLTEAPTETPEGDGRGDPPESFGRPPDEVEYPGAAGGAPARVVTTDAFEPDEVPMYLDVSPAAGELPAELAFELSNDTEVQFTFGPYHYDIWKRVDGEWFHILPDGADDLGARLRPGSSYDWSFLFTGDDPFETGQNAKTRIDGFGAGSYAFTIAGTLHDGDWSERVGFGARFELSGDEVGVEATPDTEANRDGDTVHVTSDELRDGMMEAAFVVERAPGAENAERLIPEQVIRPRMGRGYLLRNALAHFEEGVDTVRQEGYSPSYPHPFGLRSSYRVEFEGETYRVSAESLEDEEE